MRFESIEVEVAGPGVGLIRLARPAKLNALSIAMRREISTCLDAWRDDARVGAVVLTGSGRAFSAGFDLDEFRDADRHAEILATSSRYHRDVWSFPKPTIAAVNGLAAGGGFDLATLCDLRIAAEGAWFAHPELGHGAPPLLTPLRWIVGDGVALDLCLTRRRMDAREALQARLVSRVCTPDELPGAALDLARTVLAAPPAGLRFFKECTARTRGATFEQAFTEEHDRAFREVLLPAMRTSGGGSGSNGRTWTPPSSGS